MYEYHFGLNDERYEKEMNELKCILDKKGYVTESDHWIAYQMQYPKAKKDVDSWLRENGYPEGIQTAGTYGAAGVYDLYDPTRISYEENREILKADNQRQLKEAEDDF